MVDGGTAVIFAAEHSLTQTRVAIKLMHRERSASAEARGRFLREARASACVRQAHAIRITEANATNEVPYLVMDLLEGEDLSRRLARECTMSFEDTVDIALPVVSAIVACHDAGVIHRDLKPSNIFLRQHEDGSESPTIIDFGISKLVSGSAGAVRTHSRALLGSVHYVAQEQAQRSSAATSLSDQYSLGAVLYECTTGGPPFWGDDHYCVLHAKMTEPLVPLRVLNPSLLSAFEAVVVRALAKEPSARFASMRALGAALLPFAHPSTRKRWSFEFENPSCILVGA